MDIKLNTGEAVALAEQQTSEIADNSRIKVTSQPTFESAKLQLQNLKKVEKFVTEKKEGITKPLNEALKNTRDLFRPIEDKLYVIKTYLNSQMLDYNRKLLAEQAKREQEAIAKIQEANAKGEEVDMVKVTKKVENVVQKIVQIRTMKIKKLRILDVALIPKAFIVPNEVLIKESFKNGIPVPGCEMYEEEVAVNSY